MKKFIIKVMFIALALVSLSAVAFASDNAQPEALSIAQELLANGSYTCSYADETNAAAGALKREIQNYVDALSSESETPSLSMKIRTAADGSRSLFITLNSVNHADAASISVNMTTGQDVAGINAYLCSQLSYDKEVAADASKQSLSASSFTAAGSLATGKAVCQGYANAFAMFAEANGFQVIKVRGYNKSGEFHVMNMVKTETGLKVVDVTANDSNNNGNYLLVSFEEYAQKTSFQSAIDFNAAFAAKYTA